MRDIYGWIQSELEDAGVPAQIICARQFIQL
jgi:hypothetical protein